MKLTFTTILFLALLSGSQIFAQDSNKEARTKSIQQLVDEKRYIFRAQSATPTTGGIQQLSRGFDLRVMPDTVIAYLPYYGRLYQAPINTAESGIKFTSTNFDYVQKARKKGGWDITIKPKDVRNSVQLFLTISPNGNTFVNFMSTDRQSISYKGNVEILGKN